MHVRALAVACARAVRRIEDQIRLIRENEKRLAEFGFPNLAAVLQEIEREESAKAPAPMPKTVETNREEASAATPVDRKPEVEELLKRIAEGSKIFRNSGW